MDNLHILHVSAAVYSLKLDYCAYELSNSCFDLHVVSHKHDDGTAT
jgi:hypothetical protein